MVYRVIPSDNLVVIQVVRGRCRVARQKEIALEKEARKAVEDVVEDEHDPRRAGGAGRVAVTTCDCDVPESQSMTGSFAHCADKKRQRG